MAFTPATLHMVLDSVAGGSLRLYGYDTADTLPTVLGTSYFVGGVKRGLRVKDLIVVRPSGGGESYIVQISSAGASDATAMDFTESVVVGTGASAQAADTGLQGFFYGYRLTDGYGLFAGRGTSASPVSTASSPIISILNSRDTTTSGLKTPAAITGIAFKRAGGVRVSAVFGEAISETSITGDFVEGGRFHGIVNSGSHGSAYGVISLAQGVNGGVTDYVIGSEAEVVRLQGVDAPVTQLFDRGHIAASFLATCRVGDKPDAGFLTNPYNVIKFRTGFLVGQDSCDATAFANQADVVAGLDLSKGTYSWATILLPNAVAIRARNAGNTTDHNIIYYDASNILVLGGEATSIALAKTTDIAGDLTFNGAAWTSDAATPTSEGGSFTTVAGARRYKKLGRTVVIQIQVHITLKGTATGVVTVPLPYTPAGSTSDKWILSGRIETTGDVAMGVISGGIASVVIHGQTYASAIDDAQYVYLTGVYETAS